MSFSENSLTLITLASLFILGPAIGHAAVSCVDWQKWPVPIQHLLVGFCMMAAVAGMILAYGVLWERNPKWVAWYGFVQDVAPVGKGVLPEPMKAQQPLKK